jgi:tRNA(fMet)-specific endonuclease VapC
MILLDTDHISVLQWEGEAAERLRRRMADSTDEWLGITSITLEEQTRAAISRLGQSKTTHSQVKYYALLSSLFRFFSDWRVAPFDEAAATMFDELRVKKVSIGSCDLKIAATAIVNDATLLTANTIDFEKVPGLRFESWLS